MKDAVTKIKSALASKDMGAFLNHYLIADGEILATDGRITAGYPSDCGVSALVPGPELEALVGRLADDLTVTAQENAIKLASGRMHGTIQTLPPDSVVFHRPEGEWRKPPANFIEALRHARPFIADQSVQQWALCACMRSGAILASNNISLVMVECPGLESDVDILLPSRAVDFVLGAKAPLTEYIVNENHAAFMWEDGLWLRAQLVIGAFPTAASNLLAQQTDTTVAFTKEWKKAYTSVAGISESIITIEPERIVGGKGKARVEHETPMPELAASIHFNPKFLDNVVNVATHWEPSCYPKPIPFRGPGLYGLVMGRQQ